MSKASPKRHLLKTSKLQKLIGKSLRIHCAKIILVLLKQVLISFMERLISAGMDEVELYFREQNSLKVQVSGGKINNVSESETRGVAARVITDKKLAFSYTSDFSEQGLGYLQESLESFLQIAEPDEANCFAEPQEFSEAELLLADDGFQDTLFLTERAKELEASALKVDGVTSVPLAEAESSLENVLIINSHNLDVGFTRTGYFQLVEAIAEGEGRVERVVKFNCARRRSNLSPPRSLGEDCGRLASAFLKSGHILPGERTIILSKEAASELVKLLEACLSAEEIINESSIFVGKLSEKVAGECLTLRENPFMPDGYYSCYFDGEGVPTQEKLLIEKGVLKSYLHNLYSAKKLGFKPTGNAGRDGYSAPPGTCAYNLFIEKGDRSEDELISTVDDGMLVTTISGHPLDFRSGNFCARARGWRILKGRISEPISNVEISAPFTDLIERIDGVASDIDFRMPHPAPAIRIERMMVGGS